MLGTDLRTIQELGGWRSIKMVERYAHLSEDHKRAAIEGLTRGKMTQFSPPAKMLPILNRCKSLKHKALGRSYSAAYFCFHSMRTPTVNRGRAKSNRKP